MQRAEAPPVACWCTVTALCTCVPSVHYRTCARQVERSRWVKGDRGRFITALLAWAVKHDWGHKVLVSLSIPGEISQNRQTVISVLGYAYAVEAELQQQGFIVAFEGAKNSLNVALADRYLKWTIMEKSLCSLLNLCPTNKIDSMLTTAEVFGSVVSINPHSAVLKLKC